MAMQRTQRGAIMMEVLATMALTVIGLYGLMEVHLQLRQSEIESYQRSHALLLLEDIQSRLETNRNEVESYLISETMPYYGNGMNCPTATATTAERDIREWCLALQGTAEALDGNNVGAMIGSRGCIEETSPGSGQFMVSLVWQGLYPVAAPPSAVTCGTGLFNDEINGTSGCVDDLCRRYVTTMVRIASL